jgi:two-component sensor histidine kinase
MVLHELATNAGKYGSLSTPEGRIEISWSRSGEESGERLDLTWAEIGGPSVQPARRRGFGLKLIEKEISYNLRGECDITFAPSGLLARIGFALDES